MDAVWLAERLTDAVDEGVWLGVRVSEAVLVCNGEEDWQSDGE